jgi:thioredoxin 1
MIAALDMTLAEFTAFSINKPTQLLVVMIKATWCAPCKRIYPQIVELAANYPSVVFYSLEMDSESDIVAHLSPTKVPTFYLIKNGAIIATHVGTDVYALENNINDCL